MESGMSRRTAAQLVQQGWLRRLLRGTYLLGGGEPTAWQQAVAAWVATGSTGAISHWSAAGVHRLPCLLLAGTIPEVSQADGHNRPSGVAVHRVKRLDGPDVELRRSVTVTSAARTLVDLAPRLDARLLGRVVDEGAIARLWTPAALAEAAARTGRTRDLDQLWSVIKLRLEDRRVDSHLERRVAKVLSGLGSFVTRYQVVLDGQVVVLDLAVPELKLAVESDGWAVRSRSRGKFDADRRRSNLLAAHGWTVVHVTSAMTDDEIRAAIFGVLVTWSAASRVGQPIGRPEPETRH